MAEFLRPDVFVIEQDGVPPVVGVGISSGGMVGVAERGPVGRAVLTTTFSQYVEVFGGFFRGNYLTHAAKAFFDEGGTRLWITRVVEDEIASLLVTGAEVNENAIEWTSLLGGANGDAITVELVDPAGPSVPLSVAVAGNAITVTLETDGGSSIVSLASEVISLILADADASALVDVDDFGTSDGTGIVVAEAVQNLAGGAGAVPSFIRAKDHAGVDTLKYTATSAGAWANGVAVSTEVYSFKSTATLSNGDTSLAISSLLGVDVGDIVTVDDGTTSGSVVVSGTNLSTSSIEFVAVSGLSGVIAVGATVKSGSQHRLSTRSIETLSTGETSLLVSNTSSARIGQVLSITDGTTETTVVITGINGNAIEFDAVTLGSSITSNAVVASQEFKIDVIENESVVESHNFLSMSPSNQGDYVANRLSGDGNGSVNIEIEVLSSGTAKPLNIPAPDNSLRLALGLDGQDPGDLEFIGSEPENTGIFAFNKVDAGLVNFLATPGVTSVAVTKNGINYSENRGNVIYIADAPQTDDTALEVIEYRDIELNADSSYAALYYPWVVIQDPETSGRLQMPPSGHVMGIYSITAALRGVHKAPANVPLSGGVLDLTNRATDGEHDVLNPKGINVIRARAGQGIRVMGGRTLASVKDGRHYVNVRNLLNFVKSSISESSRFALFEPIGTQLFDDLRKANTDFLLSLWHEGALFPTNDASRAFFVKVDDETTTQFDVEQGRVNIEIGINPSRPAEFVVFKISLFSGEVSVSEVL